MGEHEMKGQSPVAVRIDGQPTGAGTFRVESMSAPGQSWAVEWESPRAVWCGCPAFARSHNQRCKHVLAAFTAVTREWVERRTAEVKPRVERIAS